MFVLVLFVVRHLSFGLAYFFPEYHSSGLVARRRIFDTAQLSSLTSQMSDLAVLQQKQKGTQTGQHLVTCSLGRSKH